MVAVGADTRGGGVWIARIKKNVKFPSESIARNMAKLLLHRSLTLVGSAY